MNSYERGQAIKAATEDAIQEMEVIDTTAMLELQSVYQRVLNRFINNLSNIAKGGSIYIEHIQLVTDAIEALVDELYIHSTSMLSQHIKEAVATAQGINPLIYTTAAQAIWELEQADGLKLSSRLWSLTSYTKSQLMHSLRLAVVRADNANQSARHFLTQNLAIPENLKQDLDQNSISNLSKLTGRDLMTGKGSSLHNAQRLFRTEITRAYHMAYMDITNDPDLNITGYKFSLSPAHPRPDICDMYAKSNPYGLGIGVYPRHIINNIYPAHPNTKSRVRAVYKSEKQDKTLQSKTTWLLQQNIDTQEAILGKKKAELLRKGLLTESELEKPLYMLKNK